MIVMEGGVYANRETGDMSRVVFIEDGMVFSIALEGSDTAVPVPMGLEAFKESVEETGSLLPQEPPSNAVSSERIAQKSKELRDKRYITISEVWSDRAKRRLLLAKSTRPAIVAEIAEKLGVSKLTAKRLLTRFWRGGMSLNSTAPLFKGPYPAAGRTGNPKPKKGEGGVGVGPAEDEMFSKGYARYRLNKKFSLKTTYQLTLGDNYCIRHEDGSYEYPDGMPAPTYNQFYYWVQKNRNYEEELRRLLSDKEYENNHAPTYSCTKSQVRGCGGRCEMDATHLNVEVVSELDGKCLGTPLLHLLVDSYSKMVFGYCLSLESESWYTTGLTILNAATDKREHCRKHGIEIEDWQWPARYLPGTIISDNGPEKTKHVEMAVHDQDLAFEFTTSYKGSAKGNVEGANHSFKSFVKEFLPGALADWAKRSGRKSDTFPSLTMRELEPCVIRLILFFNTMPITGYPPPVDLINEGKIASPINLWDYSFSEGTIDLHELKGDREDFRRTLLPTATAKVHKNGVTFHRMTYSSREPGVRNRLLALNKRNKEETFHYNPKDPREIYLRDERGGEEGMVFLKLELSDGYGEYSSMQFAEIDLRMDEYAEILKQDERRQTELSINLKRQFVDLREEKLKGPKPKRADSAGKREARKRDAAAVLEDGGDARDAAASPLPEVAGDARADAIEHKSKISEKINKARKLAKKEEG